ncbi:hypothetical protein O7602_18660 [Micromonospora sp. WMMD1128]|uniref:hypothetical protein n=1 Tax=unclassified Micromonospora TaxID=2617518 RepID=UPI00248A9A58|nr:MULTISPECIES: hypothetical protein [unclassified Micromonospora]WBB71757.1 hypothetical protein O7602_18660 [Micromonospora sp. WMMD1128]WFE34797.1 hypothetical protein O7613_05260 [Micromonospora sp. WMMD975]
MLSEPTTLLDRPRPSSPPPPLDWLTLAGAFEVACLVRCTPPPAADVRRLDSDPYRGGTAEFNREDAARRMRQLLRRLDVPVEHELTTGGLRRRYELHRLSVPPGHRSAYANLLAAGWRQGRRELLGGPVPGASTARRLWRPRLAAAAWRAALLAGGRHVRRHCLGIRLADRDLAAVLVRGAALLEVPAVLRPGSGCFLVSVSNGEHRVRITESAALG